MPNDREVFPVLEDGSGNGVGISERTDGDAEGSASAIPALGNKKTDGTLSYQETNNEGESSGDTEAVPSLAFKDPDGNLIFPTTDASGAINVNQGGGGQIEKDYAVAAATKGSDIDTAVISGVSISAGDSVSDIEFHGSSTKPVLWKVISVDDALGSPVLTTIFSFITGSGDFSGPALMPRHLDYTAAATGEQNLKLTGNQLVGSGGDSDLHGYIACKVS